MKTKNRLLASVLCLLTVAFCVVGLVACGEDECTHQWGEWSTTINATCTEAGAQERKCSECGETERSTIDALGHDWNEATCTTPKTCKICSATEGTASAHAYTVETVKSEALKSAATCTSAAVYYKSCSCGAISTNDADTFTSGSALEHIDANKDHACDHNCGENIGTCADANKDHACDYGCNKTFGTCADANKDHACDYGCKKTFGTCEDANKDHDCDYGCDKTFGDCVDEDKDHACDYGCDKTFGACVDENKDHDCDYGCDKTFGTCTDANKDHDCDYGCDKTFGDCVDENKDHDCDYGCDKTFGDCVDEDKDHACDYGCDKTFGACVDENKDHACDYGCNKFIGTCEDADKDHACDYGCNKFIGTCEDADFDHACDHGCDKTFGDCVDEDKDHACDYGCDKTFGDCVDEDKDHDCDYGCNKFIGTCEDADKDHACDYGCNKFIGTCEDADFDHACDYGCDEIFGACEDTNNDHECDHGCKKTFGDHSDSDADDDHFCDYGCGANIEECSDIDNDNDHSCDICGNTDITAHRFSDATCGAPATCSECGATTGSTLDHKDENHDHICDNGCNKNDMGDHFDSNTDNDHFCDYGCYAVIESCSDVETDDDHDCDVCGKENVTSHDHVENTALATEATCHAAATKTYECNCGDTYTEDDGDALGHDITDVKAEERHVNGCEYVLVYVCQRNGCGEEVLGEAVHKHNYIASISKPATCSAPGEKTFKCNACGDTSKAPEVIPADATGHNWTEGSVVDGVRTDTCSVCSETKTVTVYTGNKTDEVNAGDLADKEIELNDANISLDSGVIDTIGDQNVTVSADKLEGDDRTDLGLSQDQLAQVGDSPVYNFTINNGTENISNFGEENYVTITLPYTLTEGEDVDSIAVWFINDEGELESIPATYNNGYVTFKTNHFSYYTVTRLTPAQRCELYGHGYAEQVVEGSCTKDGYVLLVCVRCHDKQIKEGTFNKADGHDYSSTTYDATCTEDGYVLYACNDCNHSYRTKINATGHIWTEIDSRERSCTEDGYIKYGCENCEEEYTVTYPKTGHVYTDTVVPATCASDGYTIHDCDNCEYSYTDTYVEALGHNYEAGEWTWEANGNKATLTLVCEHDETHVTELRVISTMKKEVEKGACSNYVIRTHTATVEYNGVTYTDVMVIRQGNPTHKFSSDWTTDEDKHWHECICGAKTDEAEHTFGDATTTKEPTCVDAGESTSYCTECGEAKVTAIPATGVHNYVNGFCDTCGKEETGCDHTDVHREVIDFGELGACDWKLYYFTCDCGEVKTFNIQNIDTCCDFDDYESDEYIDENGNTVRTMKSVCHCGLEVSATVVSTKDGCTEIYTFDYTFKFNGEVVVDVGYIETDARHQKEKVTVYLSEYGACGGSLTVYKCAVCGEVDGIYSIDVDCDMDPGAEPDVEEVTDENGVVHYIQKVECPDCDLEIILDTWEESLSVCEKFMHITMKVVYGETVIAEYHDDFIDDTHEYEYTYEIEGNDCNNGYKVIIHCTVCGETDEWWNSGHINESFEINLADHNGCNGIISGYRCAICGKVNYLNSMDSECDFGDATSEQIVDEDGNIHYITTMICSDCGLRFVSERWEVQESACVICQYGKTYIYAGEECIFEYTSSNANSSHSYEYSYELEGGTCQDGYRVICYCTVCGETDEWWSSGHRNESFEINLADHNGCNGIISGYRCAICGKVDYLNSMNLDCDFGNATSEQIVDEYGNTHNVTTQICTRCGLKFVTDTWITSESGCVSINHGMITVYSGEDTIIEYKTAQTNETHQYNTTYEMMGDDCDDGYYVNKYCTVCGENERYERWGHLSEWRQIDLGELGLCDGSIEERYCSVCNTVIDSNIYDNCHWDHVGKNEDGYNVFECQSCGATRLNYSYDTEKDENCEYKRIETYIYFVGGEEIYRCERTYWNQRHEYEYDYIMNGASCTDGYTVITTCKNCDMHNERTAKHHELYTLLNLREGHEGVCDDHYVYVYSCPCGEKFQIRFDDYSFRYDEKLQMYVCDDCGIAISYNITEIEEGCYVTVITNLDVYYDGEELYSVEKEELHSNHNFTDVEVSTVDGVTYITTTCDKCDTVNCTEILSVEMEQHDGEYYYDYTFTPEETAKYTIIGLSDRDTCVTLYKMEGGKLVEISYNDDDGFNSQFYLTNNLTAGTTYVYRIGFYGYDEDGNINFTLSQGAESETVCKHNYSKELTVLLEGSETCEDGALNVTICVECGCVEYTQVEHHHKIVEKDRVDLAEKGACHGEFVFFSCACGQKHSISFRNSCCNTWTENEYYDEEGRLIHVSVRSCSKCGLRYTLSYYTVKDHTNCTLTYYYTVVINVGERLIAETEYTVVEADHDYEITGTLKNGTGSSCNDGVVITYKCKDCEHEYRNEAYHHETFEKEHLDLFELGSVCGGYATVYGCACGEENWLSLDHSLCEWGNKNCKIWIEDILTDSQYNINGLYSFYHNALIYVCAVTDPEDAACAYKIRYAEYWLKEANSCMAYRYETWQFGYNEETGTYSYEITFKTGDRRDCHNYVDSSTENHRKYDCPDCGSYYYEFWYYDGNNTLTKHEMYVSNTLNNGQNKYSEAVEEYAKNSSGDRYISREYGKRIYADNSEYWYERLNTRQDYTGPFGDSGRKILSSYTNSDGESYSEEYAYVLYKGYSYRIYTLRTEGDYWYRYDYSYSFNNSCEQTEIYTDSNGAYRENKQDNCKIGKFITIKKPTCSQDGEEYGECDVCGKHTEPYVVYAHDHDWVKVSDNWYYCFSCGLENANGISGSIIMEDLTDIYGNGEYYVVGYYARNDVNFSKYISLVLADGTVIDVLSGIEFTTIDGIRAFAFSKTAVEAWATENGYTDYHVRFSFVPDGSDGSFDYGITFTERIEIDTIIDDVSFTDYIGEGETKSYTITPTEDGVWTFTSYSNKDTYGYLYDAEGNHLANNDDDGYDNNFMITYELKAGETYTVKVRWYSPERAGIMALLFEREAVAAE